MTRLEVAIFLCVATGLSAAMAGAGCSSSSNSATPAAATTEGGAEASVTVDVDAGADGGVARVTLQWAVGMVSVLPSLPGDGGAGDAGVGEAAASDGGTESGAPDAVAPDSGETEDSGEPVVSDAAIDGAVASLADQPPLPGVQVCVYQDSTIPCVTTQTDGTFSLPGLPIRTDLILSLTKSGYQSALVPIETASTDMDERSNPIPLYVTGSPDLGFPIDLQTKGEIVAFAVSVSGPNMNIFTPTLGTQFSLSPASGNGPYFLDNNVFDFSATSFVGARALYYNVAPGTYMLTFANPGYDCEPISYPFGDFGWPVTTPTHSVKLVVAAGYSTGLVGALCTMSAAIVSVDGG